jgi:hypothetical protein
MRKFFFALLALFPVCLHAATPTYSTGTDQDDNAASIPTSLGTRTAGQSGLACIRVANASDVLTGVTDNVNGAWSLADKVQVTGSHWLHVYYRLNMGAGATTVTMNASGAVGMRATFHIIDGAHASGFDGAESATGTGTALNSGTVTTTVANSYIFTCASTATAEALTWASVPNVINTRHSAGAGRTYSGDFGVSATSSYAALGTWDSSVQWGAIVAAFGDAAPSTPSGGLLLRRRRS